MAKVIKAFKGVPDGGHHPVLFKVGDEVVGDLCKVAQQQGWAEKKAQPVKNKSVGNAPRNKSGSASDRDQVSGKKTAKKRGKKQK